MPAEGWTAPGLPLLRRRDGVQLSASSAGGAFRPSLVVNASASQASRTGIFRHLYLIPLISRGLSDNCISYIDQKGKLSGHWQLEVEGLGKDWPSRWKAVVPPSAKDRSLPPESTPSQERWHGRLKNKWNPSKCSNKQKARNCHRLGKYHSRQSEKTFARLQPDLLGTPKEVCIHFHVANLCFWK